MYILQFDMGVNTKYNIYYIVRLKKRNAIDSEW